MSNNFFLIKEYRIPKLEIAYEKTHHQRKVEQFRMFVLSRPKTIIDYNSFNAEKVGSFPGKIEKSIYRHKKDRSP